MVRWHHAAPVGRLQWSPLSASLRTGIRTRRCKPTTIHPAQILDRRIASRRTAAEEGTVYTSGVATDARGKIG
ncbi:MAG: hypothetical protein H8K07_10845 [Nitrospira sp.]|nr:hypothetical protein [Nitrospira sp.]